MDWAKIPEQEAIDKTTAGLQERNFDPVLVPDGGSALEKLKQMIVSNLDIAF